MKKPKPLTIHQAFDLLTSKRKWYVLNGEKPTESEKKLASQDKARAKKGTLSEPKMREYLLRSGMFEHQKETFTLKRDESK